LQLILNIVIPGFPELGRTMTENTVARYVRTATSVAVGLATLLGTPVAAAELATPPVVREPSDDVLQLPVVEVGAEGESATGPVNGFLAKRSASATKTSTDLIETPQAVTVISNDRLTTLNARSIAEAVRYTAGVSDYGGRDDPRGFAGTIRGFSPDTYLDGLRLPLAAAAQTFDIEPYGLERLEVLRGTSSALYGSGQLGGILNAVSKVPQPNQVNEVAAQGGSFGRVQGMADVGGKLVQDGSLLWRINTLLRNSGTEFDNILNNRIYVAPSLKWIGERTTVTLLGGYTQIDAGSTAQFLPAAGTVLYNRFGQVARDFNNGDKDYDLYSKRQVSAGWLIEHRATENWTLRQNLRFAHEDLSYRTVTTTGVQADGRTLTRQAQRQENSFNNLSVDNQSEVRFNTGPLRHDLLTGVDFSSQYVNIRRGQGTAPPLDLYAPVYRAVTLPAAATNTSTNQTQNQAGFYAQDQVSLGDVRLTLTGREDFVTGNLTNNLTRATTKNNPEQFTYRLGLLYASPIGISPYATYGTSFQPQTGVDRQGAGFAPQTGDQVEVGVKYKPGGLNMLFTVAAFDLTQQNVLTPDPVNTSFSVQTGEIRTRGVELEATGSITPTINVIAAVTYQEPLITRSNTAGEVGSRPVVVPSHLASLYLEKKIPVSDTMTVSIGGGTRYTGSTAGAVPNTFTVPSQVMFDLNARVDMERWRLQVNATNLTDRTYVAACVRSTSCSYATGRAVYATLAYRW